MSPKAVRGRSTSRKGAALSPHAQAVTHAPADAAAEVHVVWGGDALGGEQSITSQGRRAARKTSRRSGMRS